MVDQATSDEISCETQGHLWGWNDLCVMCKAPKPKEAAPSKSRSLDEIKACVAAFNHYAARGPHYKTQELFDLEVALAEIERLTLELAETRKVRNGWCAAYTAKRDELASMEARCASGSNSANGSSNPDIREDTVRQARDTLCDASSLAPESEREFVDVGDGQPPIEL